MGIRTSITILTLVIMSSALPVSFTGSPDTHQGQPPTLEQKKEHAKKLGVILKGMTKKEVRETFGLLVPELWYTPYGHEVWYYRSPKPQNIYFNDDKVERIEYFPEEERPPVKQEL